MIDFFENDVNNKTAAKREVNNTIRLDILYICIFFSFDCNLVKNSSILIFYRIIVLPIYPFIRHYQRMIFQTRRKGISTTRNGTFTTKLKKMKMMIPVSIPLIRALEGTLQGVSRRSPGRSRP